MKLYEFLRCSRLSVALFDINLIFKWILDEIKTIQRHGAVAEDEQHKFRSVFVSDSSAL